MTNAVVKKKEGLLSEDGLDANWFGHLAELAGDGFEDVTSADLSMPMFRLLQSLSPETKRSDPAYIEGAAEGMWLDVLGRQVYDSIIFVPSRFSPQILEWKPRSEGGGLVANHGTDRSILARCTRDERTGRDVTPEGNEIAPTGTWYGVVVSGIVGNDVSHLNKDAVISFRGTQQKVSRKILAHAAGLRIPGPKGPFTPPMYSLAYRLSSSPTKNERGSWSLAAFEYIGFSFDLPDGKSVFEQAKAFHALSKSMQTRSIEHEREVDVSVDIPF